MKDVCRSMLAHGTPRTAKSDRSHQRHWRDACYGNSVAGPLPQMQKQTHSVFVLNAPQKHKVYPEAVAALCEWPKTMHSCHSCTAWTTSRNRVHTHVVQEHKVYPEAVAALCDGRVTWREDGVPIIWEGH